MGSSLSSRSAPAIQAVARVTLRTRSATGLLLSNTFSASCATRAMGSKPMPAAPPLMVCNRRDSSWTIGPARAPVACSN